MPSIQGTQGMRKVLPPAEDGLDQQPILWECGAPHHLISIGPGDSITYLRHKLLDGLTGHTEDILQGGVAVTRGKMSGGYCQLNSWTHRISHQSPVPLQLSSDCLLQLLIELKRHLDLVSICHRVISVEPWHRSAVLTLFLKLCPG